jgi:glutamine synthetase
MQIAHTDLDQNKKQIEILNELEQANIKWVRLNFCDPFGYLQQISVHSDEITEESFRNGIPRLDGSSIKGFKEIQESDMILKPDPSTFAILPDYFDKDHHNMLQGALVCLSISMKVLIIHVTREILALLHRRPIKLQRIKVLRKAIGVQN